MPRINLDDETERWRYRCPAGHTQWAAINGGFHCSACAEYWDSDVDPSFKELHDNKTGETIPREDIEFVAETARHHKAEYSVSLLDEDGEVA